MQEIKIDKIFIDPAAADYKLTKNIVKNAKGIEIITATPEKVLDSFRNYDSIDSSKLNLMVTLDHGRQLKRCPGTRGMICCNYFVINQGVGCPFDCSYCFLQDFYNLPVTLIYANLDDLLMEVKEHTTRNPCKFFRIGTGEMTDSLAFDNLTELTKILVPFFNEISNAMLELKTKSKNIENLLEIKHSNNVVVSWSLNPQSIIDTDELFTASLEERIISAEKIQNAGYKLAFHFDPLILIKNWKKEYLSVINILKKHINPESIQWISLGTFRYKPGMKKTMDMRFPHSILTSGEHVLSQDGKMRYFKELRLEIYKYISDQLKNWHESIFLYFCMEDSDIWEKVLKKNPRNFKDVDTMFQKSISSD